MNHNGIGEAIVVGLTINDYMSVIGKMRRRQSDAFLIVSLVPGFFSSVPIILGKQ